MGQVAFRQEWARANAAFYQANSPSEHFATSVQLDPAIANTMGRELESLGSRALHVTDLGADDGRLLEQMIALCPNPDRLHWRAIDLRPRPHGLDPRIEWIQDDAAAALPGLPSETGLVIAHELLDDIACDVVECDADGRPHALVVEDGEGIPGPALADRRACEDLGIDAETAGSWLARWWPALRPFGRYEVGIQRETLWRSALRAAGDGTAIAVDYGHVRSDRDQEWAHGGTLVGYRGGRVCTPRVDGSANVTAHVAFDALAGSALHRQHEVDAAWRVRRQQSFFWLRAHHARTLLGRAA